MPGYGRLAFVRRVSSFVRLAIALGEKMKPQRTTAATRSINFRTPLPACVIHRTRVLCVENQRLNPLPSPRSPFPTSSPFRMVYTFLYCF